MNTVQYTHTKDVFTGDTLSSDSNDDPTCNLLLVAFLTVLGLL